MDQYFEDPSIPIIYKANSSNSKKDKNSLELIWQIQNMSVGSKSLIKSDEFRN